MPFLQVTNIDLGPVMSLNSLDESPVCSAQFTGSLTKTLNFNIKHGYNLVYLGVKGACCSIKAGTSEGCSGFDAGGKGYMQVIPVPKKGLDGKKVVKQQYRSVELLTVTSDSNHSEALYSIRSQVRTKYGLNVSVHGSLKFPCLDRERNGQRSMQYDAK